MPTRRQRQRRRSWAITSPPCDGVNCNQKDPANPKGRVLRLLQAVRGRRIMPPMIRHWFHLVLGLTLCGAGAWGMAKAVGHAWPYWTVAGWPAVTAEIVDVVPARTIAWREGEAQFRLQVRYTGANGTAVNALTADTIGGERLRILREAAGTAGPAMATALVYYDPRDPAEVRLGRIGRDSAWTYAGVLSLLGVLAAALAAFGLRRIFGAAISLLEEFRPSGRIAPDNR